MAPLKKDPSKVKSKAIHIRITPDEHKALQEWNKRAKLRPTTNDPANISELIRQAIIKATANK